MPSRVEDEAREAVEALTALRDAALSECGIAAGADGPKLPFDLVWRASMTAADLADEAMRVASECASEHSDFRSGCVYCYACRSAACEHVRPSESGHVFVGYESTGRPCWAELFNFLLQLGDPRTDLLFARPPETLARVVGRRRLVEDQLTSFGKNSLTYRIWGQVVAGYFRMRPLRAALTIQLVETRDHRLHLQVLTDPRLQDAMANAPADKRSAFHRVHDALAEARRQVFSLGGVWHSANRKEGRHETQEKAFAILRHVAHSIERKGRQLRRRTAHAEARGQQQRPVHKAHDDLVNGAATDFLRDAVRDSIIVLGKGGRMHAFALDGRHITSMTIGGDELERRRRRNRYVRVEPDMLEEFRDAALAAMSPRSAAAG